MTVTWTNQKVLIATTNSESYASSSSSTPAFSPRNTSTLVSMDDTFASSSNVVAAPTSLSSSSSGLKSKRSKSAPSSSKSTSKISPNPGSFSSNTPPVILRNVKREAESVENISSSSSTSFLLDPLSRSSQMSSKSASSTNNNPVMLKDVKGKSASSSSPNIFVPTQLKSVDNPSSSSAVIPTSLSSPTIIPMDMEDDPTNHSSTVLLRSMDSTSSSMSTSAASSRRNSPIAPKKSDPLISHLFDVIILGLTNDTSRATMLAPKDTRKEIYEKAVTESLFYSLLEGIPSQKIPLKMEIMDLTLLELNKYCSSKPDDPGHNEYVDKKYIITTISAAFRILFRDGKWKPEYGTNFFRKLHRLNTSSAGKKNTVSTLFDRIEEMEDTTYVQEVVDAGLAARYLSKKTQNLKNQFEPIRDILLVEKGDDSKESTQIAMVKASNTFFTDKGAGAFKEMTIATKYIYMDSLREFLLSSTLPTSQKHSTKNPMQVTNIATSISGKPCTVSFGWVSDGATMLIKAITVSWDRPKVVLQDFNDDSEVDLQDPCFFVQPVTVPEQSPNPQVPYYVRPLYTLKRIPGSPYLRLEKVSQEVRGEIIRLIGQLPKPKEEHRLECEIHTGIWYEKEFMHVAILTLTGIMLNIRVFRGRIQTFVKNLEDKEEFKKTLQNDLEAVRVLVANDHFISWYQPDLLKPLIAAAFPRIKEENNMTIIKERGLGEFYAVEKPGTWLLNSIETSIYNGNPDELVPLNAAPDHETSKHIQFEECKILLNAALKTKKTAVYLPIVKAMVDGLHDTMKNRFKKEKNEAGFLKIIKEIPKEKMTEIMNTSESLDQKAARLIFTLFTEKSLGIVAIEKQKGKVQEFLKLDG